MENLQGSTLPQSQRAAFNVLRPILHVLRSSGYTESDLRSISERALGLYTHTAARGVWLDYATFLQLGEILTVWTRDPEFIDETGSPMRLRLDGAARPGAGSFAYLLKKARVALGVGGALAQLQALGSVQRCGRSQRVRLVSSVLLGVMGNRFLAAPLLEAMRRYAETLECNACKKASSAQGLLHRWVSCASLDTGKLDEMQRFMRSSGAILLDAAHDKLLSCSVGNTKDRMLYGVGLYVYVDRAGKSARRESLQRGASG